MQERIKRPYIYWTLFFVCFGSFFCTELRLLDFEAVANCLHIFNTMFFSGIKITAINRSYLNIPACFHVYNNKVVNEVMFLE